MQSINDVLTAPAAQVAELAPATVLYTPGGTRRRAALAGMGTSTEEYAQWSRRQAVKSVAHFFALGVRHVFTNALCPSQLAEVGRYRDRLLDWTVEGLAGAEALADYARLGWRIKIVGGGDIPAIREAAVRLDVLAPKGDAPTLWWCVTDTQGGYWTMLLDAVHRSGARTQHEAIRALYGEDVPPASLWLGFGKPSFSADMLPLLLTDAVQCYWDQRPGYVLDEAMLRRILYDYACLRRTWTEDKSSRYRDVQDQQEEWDRPQVLGLGRRIGGFWYPMAEQDQVGDAE